MPPLPPPAPDCRTLLIVDDQPANRGLLREVLAAAGYLVQEAASGAAALTVAAELQPDLIVLDIMMPEMDGYEVCRRLKETPETAGIPIIFVTALHSLEEEIKGFALGAVDYIGKPFQPAILCSRIHTQLELRRQQQALAAQGQQLAQANAELQRESLARQAAEKSSVKKSEQLAILLATLPIVPYSCRVESNFAPLYVGATVAEFTGYTPEQFTATPGFWAEHIHPDDRGIVLAGIRKHLDLDKESCTYRFRIADGSYRWFRDTMRLIRHPDGSPSHIVGIWHDITREEETRREYEFKLQQIIQSHKLASLGEVVAGVAHEINNPNSFITYNIPMMRETWEMVAPILADFAADHPGWQSNGLGLGELCQEMEEIIESIGIGSERINKVVTNLKDFVRLDEGKKAGPVRINEVIATTITIVGAQLRKAIARIDLDLAPDLPEISGHFQKLEQVVVNLLVNASHAIPLREEGRLKISSRFLPRFDAVMVAIEDNGAGMTPEVLKRIFEPFYTTRRETGGTGLGLSVSYGLIREHNGIIDVQSKTGVGTVFRLILPRERRGARLPFEPTVLCVDDDPLFLDLLNDFFRRRTNISPQTLSDPATVLAFLDDHPEVSLVVSDIKMPGLDGWQLLAQIKGRFPLLPVILCTGHLDEHARPPELPAPEYLLTKPFDKQEISDLVNTIHGQRLWVY